MDVQEFGVAAFAGRRRIRRWVVVATSPGVVVVVSVPVAVLVAVRAVVAAAIGRHANEQGRARIQARRSRGEVRLL